MSRTTAIAVSVGVLIALAAVILGLRSCSAEDTSGLAAVASAAAQESGEAVDGASARPSPTGPSLEEQQIAWAGEFCRSREVLTSSVKGLGSNLDWSFGTDRSVLDQLDQQIRWRVLGIASAANDLGMLMTRAPVDPAQANDWVVAVSEPAQQAQGSVAEVTTHLDAMLSADGLLAGIAEAGQVLTSGAEAVSAGQELVAAVQATSDDAQQQFAPAFAAAPDCQGRTQ